MRYVSPRSRPLLEGTGVSAVDVIMNLFIFFFIAFSLLATFTKKKEAERERAQPIQLPASSRDAEPAEPGSVVIELGPDGRPSIDGRAVELEALTAELESRLEGERRSVLVRAHRELPLGAAVGLLDRVWAAEPASVSIATVEPEGR